MKGRFSVTLGPVVLRVTFDDRGARLTWHPADEEERPRRRKRKREEPAEE